MYMLSEPPQSFPKCFLLLFLFRFFTPEEFTIEKMAQGTHISQVKGYEICYQRKTKMLSIYKNSYVAYQNFTVTHCAEWQNFIMPS